MRGSRPLPLPYILCFIVVLVFAGLAGCARSVYRKQADHDAYDLINLQAQRLNMEPNDWNVDRPEDSRLNDPENPDHPPMPEDDPVSHELMRVGPKSPDAQAAAPQESWRKFLPGGGKGTVVLDLHQAVEVAARNSRDFQTAREELYLSALDLSEQEYAFAPHFSLGTIGSRNENGDLRRSGGPKRNARLDTTGGISLYTGWGTELITRFVNSVIWDFGQGKMSTASSLVDFALLQPLMRFGGRARVLEPLTQSERHLLGNVRRMEQYQQGFYLSIVAGRDVAPGPVRSSSTQSSALAALAGSPSGVGGVPRASGYLGLLEEQQRIRNLESNVAGLRSSLAQLQAAFDAGRASSLLQVLQARQALQSAQSSLLTARAAYETRIDSFKTDIGLPPRLPLVVRDSILTRFAIFDTATTEVQNRISDIASRLQDVDNMNADSLKVALKDLREMRPAYEARFSAARQDVVAFSEALPAREQQFEKLRNRPDAKALSLEPGRFDPKSLKAKAVASDQNLAALQKNVDTLFAEVAAIEAELPTLDFATARTRASVTASGLASSVLELALAHAGARIESVTLPPAELKEERALEVAKANRLDWMNARAELVDAWRKIDYTANPLMSGLDLKVTGELGTTQDDPQHFDARAGRLGAALQFDTPLDRLQERNDYRESQVAYQRARRDYMLFEDHVSQSLRNTLRLMDLGQLNFELRRAAVQSALAQVDLARLRLDEPPRPGQAAAQIGATAARDLVSALSDLLSAQNEFLSLWVGNEVLRMELDFELGLMELDPRGHWVEPGPFTGDQIARRLAQRGQSNGQLASANAPNSKTAAR